MNYLGIDYGERRIGLSYADDLKVAIPINPSISKTKKERLEFISKVIKERGVSAIVIGNPYNMDGSIGKIAKEVDRFIGELIELFNLPIYKVDERLSSHQAEEDLKALGMHKPKSIRKRKKIRASGDLDSRAAALILQDFLDNRQDA